MPLTDFHNKIVALQKFSAAQTVADIINENGGYISDLLRRQLRSGIDGSGEPITLRRKGGVYPFYADSTVRLKEFKGQETGYITFHDSGTFYSSIYVFASGDSFLLDSDVPYFPDILLSSGSGDKIMELTQENLQLLSNEIIKPQFEIAFNLAFNGL